MAKYGLHGKLTAVAGKGEELANILLEAAVLVADSPGCRLYIVSRDNEGSDDVWVTEVWDSKDDHDASLTQPEVRALIGRAMPLLNGAPGPGQELQVLGGTGLPD